MSAAVEVIKFVVAAIGGSGPRSTAVSFVKNSNGHRPWAWISNEIAESIVPGMVLTAEAVSVGSIERSYIKDGVETALKVPKVQLFLGGTIVIDAPEQEPLPEAVFVTTETARAYAEAYRAKRAKGATIADIADGDEVI